jgi:hypothetical protein
MIGRWIGLSDEKIKIFKEGSTPSSTFLPDKCHIIRAMDALKIKYPSQSWLFEMADLMGVSLGVNVNSNIVTHNCHCLSIKLPPIQLTKF